jgi:hypothetical protein
VDDRGNLVEMPFQPDIPVVRTEVRHEGDDIVFDNYTSMGYDDTVAHYQRLYTTQRELAPGWTLAGYGYDAGAQAMAFTLTYAHQAYALEIRPDDETGGAIVSVRGHGAHLGFQPYLQTVMPYRAFDVGSIPATSF